MQYPYKLTFAQSETAVDQILAYPRRSSPFRVCNGASRLKNLPG